MAPDGPCRRGPAREPGKTPGVVRQAAALPGQGSVFLKPTYRNWQTTIWRLLTNPGTEVAATLAVVVLATWFLMTDDASPLAGVPLFGRR